jgi:hypothetical protein
MKISLVTMDSGCSMPWDLTTECARYVLKQDSVSSTCRLPLDEELQLLESPMIALSVDSKSYNSELHEEYMMALCYNRLHLLRGIHEVEDNDKISCVTPARVVTSNWPFYKDNSIFGENYESMVEVTSISEGEHAWDYMVWLLFF